MADKIKPIGFRRINLTGFGVNGDTWVATGDGILVLRSSQSASGVWYCYIAENGTNIGAMSGIQGTGGLSYSVTVPIIKGATYKLAIGGITSVANYFYEFA